MSTRFMRLAGCVLAFSVICVFAAAPASAQAKIKVLYLTKSSGFEHSAVARKNNEPAYSEKVFKKIADEAGYEVTCTKDASLFDKPETYKTYDIFAFYATGDLTKPSKDGGAPMSPEGKKMMLKAIEDGKGVVGFHAATDCFGGGGPRVRPAENYRCDPYVAMIGGSFAGHGSQQKSDIKVVSPKFPGLENLKDFNMHEEWYTLNNIAPDMHVILVQDTNSMKNSRGQQEPQYRRPPFPMTYARMQGKGRVFYTSLGHREDVWDNPITHQVIMAGLNWAAGRTQFDPTPNLKDVCPQD